MGRFALCLLWALMIAGSAHAIPVTYFYTSGTVSVTASTDPGAVQVVGTTVLPLNGVYVTFDADTIDLTDLYLTIPMSGVIPMLSSYGGFDQFVIESASIAPGTGFATLLASDDGGGNYSFFAGPLDINGVYSASNSGGPPPAPVSNLNVPFTDDSGAISGSININTGVLTLNGITLAVLQGSEFGETDDLSIKADVSFTGVVPEPGSAALLGLGLVGLACGRRRKLLN